MTLARFARPARLIAVPGFVLLVTLPAPLSVQAADDDDGGMIQRFLQDKLSSAGRDVQISGFKGLLAGNAELAEMTISDDDGVWLILRDAVLDWNRAAMFRGNLRVEELSAGELIVVRLPAPAPESTAPTAPKAEAEGFALPELPVAIRINKLSIERAELGETVLGQEAVLGLQGSIILADGEGSVDIRTERLDGPTDHVALKGSFLNETRMLSIDLEMTEDAGGLVSSKLPGAPSLDLSVKGDGPLSDFTADIALRTDDEDRIAGDVTLKGNGDGDTSFAADIGGDITPVLPPEFHDFFGDDIRLVTQGALDSEGAFELSTLSLTAQSLDLKGSASIGPDRMPTAFALKGAMIDQDGKRVRLPVNGPAVSLDKVTLDAAFDAAQGEQWTLDAVVSGLETDAANVSSIGLNGVGDITTDPEAVTADLLFDVSGLSMADPALTEAIGEKLTGGASLSWTAGGALNLTQLYADGEDYGTTLLGDVRISERSVKVSGEGRVRADDLSRFSAISGQQLTGKADADVSGQGDVLGGQFAVTLDAEVDGLSIGNETVDPLLTEPVTLATAVRRDTEGTVVDRLELRSRAVTVDAAGKVGGGSSDIGFDAALSDIGLVMEGQTGAVALKGNAKEDAPGDWQVGVSLDAPWDLTGTVDGRVKAGESDVTLDLSLPDIAPLVPGHTGAVTVKGKAAETGKTGEWALDLDVGGPYALTAGVDGVYAPGGTDVALDISLPDVEPLAPGHTGAVNLAGTAKETDAGGWNFMLDGSGPYQAAVDLDGTMNPGQPGSITFDAGVPDLSPLVPSLSGPLTAKGTATDAGDGLWQVDVDAGGPFDGFATVDGVVGGGQSELALDVSIPDLSPLVPQLAGPLKAQGTAAEAGDGRWNVDFDADGPYGATASVDGAVGGTGTDVKVDLAVPDISPLAPGYAGALKAQAAAKQTDAGAWDLAVDAAGPYNSTVSAGGTYGNGASDLAFKAALPDIAPLAAGLSGPLSLDGTAKEAGEGAWAIDLDAGGPYNSTANIDGTVGTGVTAADIALSIPSISPFAPGVSGGVDVTGNVSQQGENLAVALQSRGPEGVSSAIDGTIAQDFSTMNLTASGTAPLGLANRSIAPASVQGTAQFDVAVNGAPSLQAVSGNVAVSGARFTIPTLGQTLDGIGVQLGLNGETLQIDATANGPDGGSVGANGTIQLTGGMNANLVASLNQFGLVDPLLYKSSLDGKVNVTGPLTGNASIDGTITVGRTEVRVPEGGLGFGGAIPNMTHVNEPGAVHLTRVRAGLVEEEKKAAKPSGGGGGPAYNLNVKIVVPGQVFIRGRGLDTEMGGGLVVQGTTAAPEPVGEVEVLRGRFDILGKRLEVTEGTVSLAGGLQPYLDITATSERDDFEFVAKITGPVDDPDFELTSIPDLPQDEVLAHFLFGDGIDNLSALQAVQLANAIATLSGKGGVGVMSNLRQGLGLDDLDLATNSDGETEVRAGKYLSDNVYTEFVADSDGDTEIDINIDLTESFTVKGTADSKGDSSIGIYWERDY